MRCSTCGINYPHNMNFSKCKVCESSTAFFGSVEPDEDWETDVKTRLDQLEVADLIPTVDAKVRCVDGNYFVHAWDVYDSVRNRLTPGDLFHVGKQTFEVLEYLEEPREYWVRPFSLELTEEDLARLAGG